MRAGLGALRVCRTSHTCVCATDSFQLCCSECELALSLCRCAMLATPACVRHTVSSFTASSASCPWCSPCALCSSHLRVCEHIFPASLFRARAGVGALSVTMLAPPTCVSSFFYGMKTTTRTQQLPGCRLEPLRLRLAGREALRRNAGYTEGYPDYATRASCLSSFTSVFDQQWRKRGCLRGGGVCLRRFKKRLRHSLPFQPTSLFGIGEFTKDYFQSV